MKILFIVLVLMVASWARAENLDSLIIAAGDKEQYPQAGAITIFDRTNVKLKADGWTYTRREFLLKIVDERAKDEEGDQSVRFNAENDTVIIESARTRLPDGRWVDPEKDAFTTTSAPEVQFASAYSQLKQRNVSFPGLDVGAAIYFAYRIEPRPEAEQPDDPRAGGIVQFGAMNPILEKTYSIETEKGRSIRYELQNSEPVSFITFDGKNTRYRWQYRDLDQIRDEPNMVSLSWLVPRLCWTTFGDWDSLGIYMTQRFWGAVDTSSQALASYAQIASPNLSGKPAVFTTALWIQQNLRTVNLPLGRVGYEPNTADRVWQNKYGDARDKCVLLAALLRGYGIQSTPVLVLNRDVPFTELPVLEQFAHLFLCVPMETDTIWLDPTLEHFSPGELPYRYSYGKACLLADGAPLVAPLPTGAEGARGATTQMSLKLEANGDLSGSVHCTPRMDLASGARAIFKDQKEQERDIYFQQAVSRFGQGTKVKDSQFTDPADLATPFAVRLSFESAAYAVKQDDLLMFELPGNPFSFGNMGFYPSLPEVEHPVQLPLRARTTTEYVIDLPKKFKVAYLPAPLLVENPYVYLELIPKQTGQTITWRQEVEIKADRVPVADYAALREAYQQFILPKNRMAMLETGK